MNTGVSTVPCDRRSVPRRAREPGSRAATENPKAMRQAISAARAPSIGTRSERERGAGERDRPPRVVADLEAQGLPALPVVLVEDLAEVGAVRSDDGGADGSRGKGGQADEGELRRQVEVVVGAGAPRRGLGRE